MPDNRPANPEGLGARQAALDVLRDILVHKKMLDVALDSSTKLNQLPTRDRAFARMLITTILRHKGQLDAVIEQVQSKKGERPSPETLVIILYIGIAQIIFMDVADHAAVDISVRLAESEGLIRQKGFVNAVLRRITREGKSWVEAQDPITLNIPGWLWQAWVKDYGEREARDIALASLTEAPLDITLKNSKETALWLGALESSCLPSGSLRRTSGGSITDLPGYREGAWWVQDASSALPVKLLGDIAGLHVIDLCAAPGGKTLQLASAGAQVTALDVSTSRMKKLMHNLERMKLTDHVHTVIADALSWQPKTQADVVLLDAPCTATGTLRRHPDLLLFKTEKDLLQLSQLQGDLLDNAAPMVKPGGILVYCTCSLQRREGEDQITSFLTRHPDFIKVTPDISRIGHMETVLTDAHDIRVKPYHLATLGGMDGFFISLLKRS
ncbi:MAG: RsmD family RNA methyltransferase [Alphaproteobacteria bacterium]|nr:RsmD family RNA methyltransferase [Alphaproteobacteria bacterium]